ncbi:MAG: DUF1080 domain-containing protein [Planctomycetia bacterium]|nr:DUF1080 domain-containing protein [Planctomycetia bacterium]
MSPEQAANTKTADARADIYSLGCTLWFLLTARKVYESDSMIGRLMAHRDGQLPSLVKTRDDVPWALEQAFHKMIAKRPQDRFQTMDEVITALGPFSDGSSSSGSRSGSGSSGGGNAELASFMKSMGNSPTTAGGMTKGGAAVSPVKPEAGSKTANAAQLDVTAQFDKSAAETDPKSEVLPAGAGVAPAASPQPRPAAKKTKSPPKNVKLIAGGIIGAALLLVAGIIVTVRDKDGNVVAEVNVPNGASVEVKPTPAAPTTTGITAAEAQRNRAAAEWCFVGTGSCEIVFAGSGAFGSTRVLSKSALPREPFYVLKIARGAPPIDSLPEIHGLSRLFEINVTNLRCPDTALEQMADLPKLDSLQIAGGRITDRGMQWVATRLTSLRQIDLRGNEGITNVGLKHLAKLPGLDLVRLGGTGVTAAGVADLKKVFPNCNVEWTASTPSTLPVGPPQSTGAVDAALKFEGKEQFVSFPTFHCDGDPPLTIEAWVTPLKTGDSFTDVIRIGDDQGSQLALRFGKKDWHFTISPQANPRVGGTAFFPAELGKRVHVAGVWRGDDIQVFVDGLRSHGHSIDRAIRSERPRGALRIGFGDFAGIVDQVRISKTFPYAGSARFDPPPQLTSDGDTLALYRFDEGRGSVAVDSSGHGRDGQIVGAQWVAADGSPLSVAPSPVATAGWTSLFNGRDLTGWTPQKGGRWTVVDGVIVGSTTDSHGWLMSDADYDDFEFECEYKLAPDSNSGVFIRAWAEGNSSDGSFHEVQLLDDKSPKFSHHSEKQRTGALYNAAAPIPQPSTPTGQWHKLYLAAIDKYARVSINGTQVVERGNIAAKRLRGRIGLQLYPTQVELRNLRVRELNPDGTPRVKAAAGSTVDLLALIDVARDAQLGEWQRLPDGLAGHNPTGASVLQFPYDAPDEYDLEIEFTPTAPGMNVNHYLASQGSMFAWKLNAHGRTPPLYGFELLDGKFSKDITEAAMQLDLPLVVGKRYRSVVKVRRGSLQTFLDDRPLVSWTGDFKRLSLESSTPMKHPGRLGIGSWKRPVTFHTAKLVTAASPVSIVAPVTAGNPTVGRVDLLALVDPKVSFNGGVWTKGPGGLRSPSEGSQWSLVKIPYEAPEEYDWDVKVERVDDKGQAFDLFFTTRGRQGTICIDGFGKPGKCALEMIEGKTGPSYPGPVLTPGKTSTIRVSVRKSGVTVVCEGKEILAWQGDMTKFSTFSNWNVPDKRNLFLGSQASFLVREMTLTPVAEAAPASASSTGDVPLFNGIDLTGWTGKPGVWKWESGELVGMQMVKGATFLYGAKRHRDFELEYEVKLEGDQANSGVQFRSTLFDEALGTTTMTGPQVEIGGTGKTGYGGLWWQSGPRNGVVKSVDPAVYQKLVKPDDYNRMTVRVVGKHVTITLNGTTTADGEFDIPPGGLPGWQLVSQGAPATARFRNIVFRDLPTGTPPK